MNPKRTKDGYQKQVYNFVKDMYVVCPSCNGKALIKIPESGYVHTKDAKLVCLQCGHNKLYNEKPAVILHVSKNKIITGKYIIIGGAVDPYFHLPLWLSTNCCDNILWAYNYEHLDFLKSHVEAKLRERNISDMRNKSLGSRLPRWMTSKKNRDTVLKAIAELKDK